MKKIYLYNILCAALLCSSCSSDWLDVYPTTSVGTDEIKTLEDLQYAMNGVYRLASAHSYYGDNYLYYGDCRAEDVQARITKGTNGRVSPYYEYNAIATDNFNIVLPWNQVYKVIRQTNNIIDKVDRGTIENADAQMLDSIKAEALVMRGLGLYDLTRFYAMPYMSDGGASLGVAIELKPEDQFHRPGRSTVAQCYDRVIKDLTDALPYLSKEKKNGRMNYWAAKALLSRVYLNKGDNENAYAAAVEVIEQNGGLYRLYTHDEYPNVWGMDFQSESLFEFYFTLSEPSGGSGGEGAPMVYADVTLDWNNLILTKAFLDLMNEDPDDVRHCITKMPVDVESDTIPAGTKGLPKYMGKYPGKDGSDPKDNNLCILRLSEIYLNAAEAGLKLGGEYTEPARGYLNAIVSRANPAKSVEAGDFTLQRILKERRKELVGEGLALYDYTRNGLTINRDGGWHLISLDAADARAIPANDPRLALPIPQSEIDANSNILKPQQ